MFNLDSFVSENYNGLYNFAISKNLQEHDAKDLAQTVMADFCQKFAENRINVSQNPKAYLFKLAKWRILDSLKYTNGQKALTDTIGEDNDLDSIPCQKINRRENEELLYEAFKLVDANPRDLGIFKNLIFMANLQKKRPNFSKQAPSLFI